MINMYKQVNDATAFVRADGSRLHSLKALEMALYTMSDSEFNNHVNGARNDFANWVLHVFQYEDLAKKMTATKTRSDMLRVIEEEASVPVKNNYSAQKSTNNENSQIVSAKANSKSNKTESISLKPNKSFHHKLKGMFKKGETAVNKENMSVYESALESAKSASHANSHPHNIHEQINHLDRQLAHMTRHHANNHSREHVGSALLEESVKERILDFSLGLIVGLMLGFILAKSLGM